MNLARFALRNPITILMAVLMVIILGIISFTKMPVDMFPEITFPSITVATFYKGANPQDIERMVTYPVEKAVSTVNGVKYVPVHLPPGCLPGYDLFQLGNQPGQRPVRCAAGRQSGSRRSAQGS